MKADSTLVQPVTLTVNTNSTTLPRDIHHWIHSLNLTYKIQNPKRDLSNGWLFAEILQRFYPNDIEMYQFDNGFKLDKKMNNWEHLQKFFKRKSIDIQFKDYDPVIHCAPNAGYQLLKKLYTVLTGREIQDELVEVQQQQRSDETASKPDYLRTTITQKMKEHELQRIQDKLLQTHTAINIVDTHVSFRKTERQDNGFNQTKQTGLYAFKEQQKSVKKALNQSNFNKTKTIDGIPVGEIKTVTVKTANKTIRTMRAEKKNNAAAQDPDDSEDVALMSVLTEIISRTITQKLSKTDPEFKVFKEHTDRGVGYFHERFQYIPDELIVDIFLALQEQIGEIISVLGKCMSDLPELIQFFATSLKVVNPMISTKGSSDTEKSSQTYNLLILMIETLTIIANKLLNQDPQQTELYFLEYGCQELIQVMASNTFKLNDMSVLLYCFVQSTNNSHLRVLKKINEKLSQASRDVMPQIIARLFLYESEQISPELYTFYYEHSVRALHSTSAITRMKAITVLSYLCRIRLEPILPILQILEKQIYCEHWELKGQLLILASNVLIQFNTEENLAVVADSKSGSEGAQEGLSKTAVDEATAIIFNIIYNIFTLNCPKATTKIGLIYLAKIIDYYPDFTQKYLEILLACPENIRSSTLEMEPLPGTEEEVYVSGANTEKYRTYGAPQEWNSLLIASALKDTILEQQLENLDWSHIEIFDACVKIEFKQSELDTWLQILNKMKNHFLISLCYRDYSLTTIRILKKFFFHLSLQQQVIQECTDIFIKTLALLYQPDTDQECKENAKELLESLHDGSSDTESTEELREFVYIVIKALARDQPDFYGKSNLIELMNHVVDARRGDIFEEEKSMTQNSSRIGQGSFGRSGTNQFKN